MKIKSEYGAELNASRFGRLEFMSFEVQGRELFVHLLEPTNPYWASGHGGGLDRLRIREKTAPGGGG